MITYSDETTDKTATVNALVENNTETLETSFDQIALSSRKIIITAGNGVRVCKVKAYVDDMTNLQKLYDLPIILTIQRTIREPAAPKRILTLRSIMTFPLMALDCFTICSRCRH